MRSRLQTIFSLGLLVVLSARCGLAAWMHWSCIDMIVLGVKSVEELYPSSPLEVDSADTSQLSKEKNLHGQFQFFPITHPGSRPESNNTAADTGSWKYFLPESCSPPE
jgi:hypothetical protein